MHAKRVLVWSLAWVGVAGGPAAAQFAKDRPALPSPVATPATAGPVTPTTPPANTHPWYVKPEVGAWMICVKSYAGPEARACAEELAKDIRETYRVPAYLFEKGSEEKKRQEEFVAKERTRQMAEQQKFLEVAEKQRQEAYQKGMDFLESPVKVRVPRYNSITEQYAVMIGGWKDMDTAHKELKKIRTWRPPANTNLMDRGVISRPGENGQRSGEVAYLNPFLYALVVPNPVAAKTSETDTLDPVIARLNEKEKLSVLRISKRYTLVVKSFHPFRRRLDGKDAEKSVMEKLFGKDDGQEMQAMANQAEKFAEALRHPKFHPHPFESYMLHTVYGTLVCVGQFDGPDDQAMYKTQAELEAIRFNVKREDSLTTQSNVQLFDPIFAMQVPKVVGK